jgi:hypothetical protein
MIHRWIERNFAPRILIPLFEELRLLAGYAGTQQKETHVTA